MLKRLSAIAPAGAVQTSVRELARWLTFQATRSPALLDEHMWRELHRPQADMPESDQPEVQHRSYALGWIHESYRGHPLVAHNGAIDGFKAGESFRIQLDSTAQLFADAKNEIKLEQVATDTTVNGTFAAIDSLSVYEPDRLARQ